MTAPRPEVLETVAEVRAVLELSRADDRGVGFVPTMGALHEGHAALLRRAASENETAVASIFVNPLQFGTGEDLGSYPRDLARDLEIAAATGIAHVFVPAVSEMYPQPVLTTVAVSGLTDAFEGAARPTHFAGVATVVTKLLSIIGPCRAYFGEKDYQQLAVVRRLVADLSLPVDVVGAATVREADGLALSSRNVYLSPAQRAAAPVLHRALLAARDLAVGGGADVAAVVAALAGPIDAEPEAELDYAALVDAATLEPATRVGGVQRLLVAAAFGTTRLLDNVAVATPAAG